MMACHIFHRLLMGVVLLPCLVAAQQNFIRPAGYPVDGSTRTVGGDLPLNEINIHAYRYLHKNWPSAVNEMWSRTGKGFAVYFMEQGIRNRVFFNSKGGFLSAMKYYAAANLNADLAGMVKKRYPDFVVQVVTEVTDGNRTCYFIRIGNGHTLRTLSFNDGKLEIYEELVNAG